MSDQITSAAGSFWARVEKSTGCWIWRGSVGVWGYGQFQPRRGRNLRAHRVAWELIRGPIPQGLVLDHLCRNKLCVNPDHLEPVTNRVNTLRGVGPSAMNAAKTECKHGHPFIAENTRIDHKGKRVCRTCDRAKWERSNARRKAGRRAKKEVAA